MLKLKYDINQQYLKTVDRHFVKSEYFSFTWSCGSRQRDTISSGWKFRLNNMAVKGLNPHWFKVLCLLGHTKEKSIRLYLLLDYSHPPIYYYIYCSAKPNNNQCDQRVTYTVFLLCRAEFWTRIFFSLEPEFYIAPLTSAVSWIDVFALPEKF